MYPSVNNYLVFEVFDFVLFGPTMFPRIDLTGKPEPAEIPHGSLRRIAVPIQKKEGQANPHQQEQIEVADDDPLKKWIFCKKKGEYTGVPCFQPLLKIHALLFDFFHVNIITLNPGVGDEKRCWQWFWVCRL